MNIMMMVVEVYPVKQTKVCLGIYIYMTGFA